MERVAFKDINKIAIPAIVAGVAEPLLSVADTAIIGRLGVDELAAVGIASSFYLSIIWVLAQTKSAISSIVSKYYGANKLNEISSLIPQSIKLNITLGILFFLLTRVLITQVLEFYGAEGNVLVLSESYFMVRSFGFPITLATFGVFGVFRGVQNTRWAMQISFLGALINVGLDFVFIYGIHELIPAMGVKGAALASVVSQAIMLVLALYVLVSKTGLVLQLSLKANKEVKNLLGLSGNLFLRTIALNVAYFLAAKYATSYGKEHIAAHTIAMNVWLFSAFFIDGYANAGNAISGRLYGAKDFKNLFLLGKDISKVSIYVSCGLGGVYVLMYPFLGYFFTNDELVVSALNAVFWLVIISQPLNGLAFAYDGIFKGLGEAKFLRNVLVYSVFLCFVPVLLIGDYFEIELLSVWIAFFFWMIARGVPLWYKFKKDYGVNKAVS